MNYHQGGIETSLARNSKDSKKGVRKLKEKEWPMMTHDYSRRAGKLENKIKGSKNSLF